MIVKGNFSLTGHGICLQRRVEKQGSWANHGGAGGCNDTVICQSSIPHGPECFFFEQRDFYPVGSPDSFLWVWCVECGVGLHCLHYWINWLVTVTETMCLWRRDEEIRGKTSFGCRRLNTVPYSVVNSARVLPLFVQITGFLPILLVSVLLCMVAATYLWYRP